MVIVRKEGRQIKIKNKVGKNQKYCLTVYEDKYGVRETNPLFRDLSNVRYGKGLIECVIYFYCI